jgi:hypothetical protein
MEEMAKEEEEGEAVQESAREDKPVVVAPAKAGKSRSRNRRKARWSSVRQVDEILAARGHLPELYCPGRGMGSPAGGAARDGGVGQAGAGKNGTWERIVFSLADRGTHRNRGPDSYSLLELGCNLGPLLFRGGPANEVWRSQFEGSRWSCSKQKISGKYKRNNVTCCSGVECAGCHRFQFQAFSLHVVFPCNF